MEYLKNIFGLLLVGIMLLCLTSIAFAETNDNGNIILDLEDGENVTN